MYVFLNMSLHIAVSKNIKWLTEEEVPEKQLNVVSNELLYLNKKTIFLTGAGFSWVQVGWSDEHQVLLTLSVVKSLKLVWNHSGFGFDVIVRDGDDQF